MNMGFAALPIFPRLSLAEILRLGAHVPASRGTIRDKTHQLTTQPTGFLYQRIHVPCHRPGTRLAAPSFQHFYIFSISISPRKPANEQPVTSNQTYYEIHVPT
jgi:hypothetical protein